MFSFGKAGKEPCADVKSVERWLAAFPANNPLVLHGELVAELGRIAGPGARRTPVQLEALFALDTRTAELRATLTAQYLGHANRSSKIERQIWSALFDLTQAFLLAYQAFGREAATRTSARWQELQPELVLRQIAHLGRDAKIRLYRYEQWIPAKWAELHTLFALALSQHVERQPVTLDPAAGPTTIEQAYLRVLLLQLVHAGNTTVGHIEYLDDQLRQWCQPLRLTIEPTPASSTYYVDLGGREGLKRRGPAPLEAQVLFLDTRPLHALLSQTIAVLEQKIRAHPTSERTPKRVEQLALLTKVAAQADPEFRPFARRGERVATAGTVDAIVGFGNIAGYLHDEERTPLRAAESGHSYGGTMDLAVFGRLRNEQERIVEQARRRLAAFAPHGGPWELKDVSQTGFRLMASMLAATAVTLGSLVALRPHGQSVWTLGIVRRMKRLTSERAEIGLQLVASALAGVDLIEQRKPHNDDYSVDGEPTTVNGRIFPGLYLALRKNGSDGALVHSLMLPAAEYQPLRKLKLQTPRSVTPIRLGRVLEQQPDWVWTAVDAIEQGAPLPNVAGAA
jgi:hypothetical protein